MSCYLKKIMDDTYYDVANGSCALIDESGTASFCFYMTTVSQLYSHKITVDKEHWRDYYKNNLFVI